MVLQTQLCSGLDLCTFLISSTMQGTPLNQGDAQLRDAWACEHFQLTSKTAQIKLKRYLQVPDIQRKCPEGLSTESAQLSWITEQATTDCSAWVGSILEEMTELDISSNHQQANAAAETVDAFRHTRPSMHKQQRQAAAAGKKRGRPGWVNFLFLVHFER